MPLNSNISFRLCRVVIFMSLLLSLLALDGCIPTPPKKINNICDIFFEKDNWYQHSRTAFEKWGAPIHVQMAIMHQESKFRADAEPKQSAWLSFFPWSTPSSAYGYSQAIDSTWDWYREKTGNYGADRENFADSVDFIGWYLNTSHQTLGLPKHDTKNQYLAYHEGHTGFRRKSYKKKNWLQKIAQKVAKQAKLYSRQLHDCREELDNIN